MELTARELNLHREKVLQALEQYDWDTALIADKENQYYLTERGRMPCWFCKEAEKCFCLYAEATSGLRRNHPCAIW